MGRLPLAMGALCLGLAVALLPPMPAHADWRQDAKKAALKYADQKKDELVRAQSKAAITALYKKLYAAKSGVSRSTSRTLAELAIAAPDIDKMASDMADAYGSGDPDKIREASEAVAVKFGEQLARLGSNAETRAALGSLIGKADKVKEISQVLGNATSGTKAGQRAAAEYLGQALIGLTPAAGVIGFYQASVGAMKYAKGEFVDSKIEDLYQAYKKGDADARKFLIEQVRVGQGGYGYVVDERRRDLEAQKAAAIGDAADSASDAVREHLTKTTEGEIIANIVASFDSRIDKEKQDKAQAKAAADAEKKVATILAPLQDAILQRNGVQALKNDPYKLDEYLHQIDLSLKNMPELDPNDDRSLTLASRSLSALLIFGRGSKEYAVALAALNNAREDAVANSVGGPCVAESKDLAVRLWTRGVTLFNAGKAAAALPYLKNSLTICPDDKRAAKVAELEKLLAAPEETGFDGQYVGRGGYGNPGYPQTPFTLRLTVSGERLSGTFVAQISKSRITQNAKVTGSVSSDGRITATVVGQSRAANKIYTGTDVNSKVGRAVNDISQMMFTYPFVGQFNGRLVGAKASGSIVVRRTTKPFWKAPKNGTWSAARQ
ncbi:MAG: hypothetical protein WCA36_03145 [Pseudolabrys sp.]